MSGDGHGQWDKQIQDETSEFFFFFSVSVVHSVHLFLIIITRCGSCCLFTSVCVMDIFLCSQNLIE